MSVMKLLVLDDEPAYGQYLKRRLETDYLQAFVAVNTSEARRIVSEHHLDLAIVDIKLAESVDGLEFADWARHQQSDLPVIVMTAYSSAEHERRSRELGVQAYLEKPFDWTELETKVRRVLDQPRMLRQLHELEQECAALREQLEAVPAAVVSRDGAIVWATELGRGVLDACAPASAGRPVERIEGRAMERALASASANGVSSTTILPRDGSLREFSVSVRRLSRRANDEFMLLFCQQTAADAVDPMWLGIFLQATRSEHRPREG